MAERHMPHEERLLAMASLIANGYEASSPGLRFVADLDLSPGAGAAWFLLRGAAQAYVRAGETHPLRDKLRLKLREAVDLARVEGLPPKPFVYTGGARPLFEKDA